MKKSEEQWRQELSSEEYRVLREAGTERAFTGAYDAHFEPGTYHCRGCDTELFAADSKFDSRCGWPSFYQELAGDRITKVLDKSHGMIRTEIRCAACDGHLGHVFNDGPEPTGLRYCVNSVSLRFHPKE